MALKAAWRAVAFAGAMITAAASQAASGSDSSAFDGTYFGQRERLDPLSGELCANFTLHSLTIEGGRLYGDGGDIAGAVEPSGFFSGSIKVFGLEQPFEGRIEDDTLIGGVVSPDAACFWLVRMIRLDNSR